MAESLQSLKGQFLIAMPGLKDPNFHRSVIFLAEHTVGGAMGVVINRIHPDIKSKMIFEALEITPFSDASRIPVYGGGPVHKNEIFILHGPPFDWKNTVRISHGVALSNSRDIIEAIAAGDPPDDHVIALGCAGWAPGQLEYELQHNTWINSPGSVSIMFTAPPESRWESAIRALGIDPEHLSEIAGSA